MTFEDRPCDRAVSYRERDVTTGTATITNMSGSHIPSGPLNVPIQRTVFLAYNTAYKRKLSKEVRYHPLPLTLSLTTPCVLR